MFDFLRNLMKSAQEKRQEALNAYLDDALTPRQRQHFEEQLAQEPELRAELAQLRLIKQQLRQLPSRSVPRNFTLDPARYGRPQRQPLLQLYPALRVATVLTAFFFILAVAAEVVTSGAGVPAIADVVATAEPFGAAEEVEVTRVVQVEVVEEGEAVEVTRLVTEEVLVEEEAMEEAAEVVEEEAMAEEPAEEPAAEMAQEVPAAEATAAATMTGEAALTPEAAADLTASPTSTPTVAATTARTAPPTATISEIPRPSPPAVEDDRALTSVVSPEAEDQEVGTAVSAQNGTTQAEQPEGGRQRPLPLSSLRLLQIGLGSLLVILAAVTLMARRRF